MDVNRFFQDYEATLLDILKNFLNKSGLSKLPRYNTNDLRLILKYLKEDWEKELKPKIPKATFKPTIFQFIKKSLNNYHHKEQTAWSELDDFVRQSISFLEALETECGLSCVPTQHARAKIESNWNSLERKTAYAFESKLQIEFEDSPELVAQRSGNSILVSGFSALPPFDEQTFLNVFANGLDVVVVRCRKVDLDTYELNLENSAQVATAVKQQTLVFKQKQLVISKVDKQNYFVQLSNIPETVSAKDIAYIIGITMNITVNDSSINIDLQESTAVIQLQSFAEYEYILNHPLRLKTKPISVIPFKPEQCQIALFFEVPCLKPDQLNTIWENMYGFSINQIEMSENQMIAVVSGTNQQMEFVLNNNIPFKFASREVTVAKYTPFVLKLKVPNDISKDDIKDAISRVIPDSFVDLAIIEASREIYLFLKDEDAKNQLLAKKAISLSKEQPKRKHYHPNQTSADNNNNENISIPSRAVVIAPLPQGISTSEMVDVIKATGVKKFFLTLKSGQAFVEAAHDKTSNFDALSNRQVLNIKGIEIGVRQIPPESVQHWNVAISPLSDDITVSDLVKAAPALVQGAKFGHIRKFGNTAIVPVPDEATYQKMLKTRQTVIKGELVYLLKEQEEIPISHVMHLQAHIIRWLKMKNKNMLEEIQSKYEVKIKLPTNNNSNTPQKQNVDNNKNKQQQPKPPKKNQLVIIGSQSGVTSAVEELDGHVANVISKTLKFEFGKHDLPLLLLMKEEVTKHAQDSEDTLIVCEAPNKEPKSQKPPSKQFSEVDGSPKKKKDAPNKKILNVTVTGPEESVGELENAMNFIKSSLVSESTKFDPKHPPTINMEQLNDLGVKITKVDAGFINVYGNNQESVTAAMDLIKQNLGSSISLGCHPMKPMQARYVELFKMEELKSTAESLDVKIVGLKESKLFFKGKFQGTEQLKKDIRTMLDHLRLDEYTKRIPRSLTRSLQAYLQKLFNPDQVIVFCDKKKAFQKKKTNSQTSTPIGSDDEENDDMFSDSHSLDSDFSLECLDNNNNSFWTKFGVDMNIFILHADEDDINLKISKIMDELYPDSSSIKATDSELKAIMNTKTRLGYLGTNVRVNARRKKIVVTCLQREKLPEAINHIKRFLEKNSVEKDFISVDANKWHYLREKKEQMDQIKANIGLKDIRFDKDKYKIEFIGNNSQVGRAKEEVHELTKTIECKTFTFDRKDMVTTKDANEMKIDLEKQLDVRLKIRERGQGFEISITGRDVDQAIQELEKQKAQEYKWTPSNYQQLAQIIFQQRKLDLNKFRTDWNLSGIYLDKQSGTVMVHARNEDDVESAKQALEGLLTQQQITSENISVSDMHWAFFSRKGSYFNKKYEEIRTNNNIIKLPESGSRLRRGQLPIRGNAEAAKKVKNQILHLIQELQSQLKIQCVDIPSTLASELIKDKWKLAVSIFNSTGVYISSPENEKSLVRVDLSGKSFKIQVVEGNILDERTDCIVNAANENLQHSGGIAKEIAEKAGLALKEECDAFIKQNQRLSTGRVMRTTAGNLPFQGILHAVGPIWNGGNNNERNLLAQVVQNCLELASENGYQSISIPAISSGIFGFPKDECTKIIVESVMTYMKKFPDCGINLIRLCDKEQEIIAKFNEHVNNQHGFEITQVSTSKKPLEVAAQWYWRENDMKFHPFDPDQNLQIETAYWRQNQKGKFNVLGDLQKVKNGYVYEIDFDAMTEINTHFRSNPRPIKRQQTEISSVKWEVQFGNQWKPFDQISTENIEIGYSKKNQFPNVNVQWNGQDGATITLIEPMQMHFQGKSYAVRRRIRDLQEEMLQYLAEENDNNAPDKMKATVPTTRIQLTGFANDLQNGLKTMQRELDSLMVTHQVPIGRKPSQAELEEFKQHCNKYGVDLKVEDTFVKLTGLSHCVSNAKADITGTLLAQAASQQISFPKNWENQEKTCELKPVINQSEEWKSVQQRFAETLPTAQILNIERVQNKWLWERYNASKMLLNKKNPSGVNEIRLFHGTSSNPPSLIYEGEFGFDMRYCSSGMWGIAIYFAQNASYSNSYAFNKNGTKQMFLTLVAVGDCKHIMPNNHSLRKPPQKEKQGTLGFVEDYDAVSGETGGSKVYMIYENGRAYPEYLITYK